MKFLIGYATTEGQTRKIARHVADRLFDHGHTIETLPLKKSGKIDLDRYDAVILGASVHVNHYQRALIRFASRNAKRLSSKPTLFLSVSLAAAGHEADDWKGLAKIVEDLSKATSWTPGRTEHVAGAYKPSDYDIFRRFVMKRIIMAKSPDADPDADHEYTDWAALDAVVDEWAGTLQK